MMKQKIIAFQRNYSIEYNKSDNTTLYYTTREFENNEPETYYRHAIETGAPI